MITEQTMEPREALSEETLRETLQRAIDRYGGEITRLCYLRLRSRADAEDAAQDTFCRYLEQLRRDGRFESDEHEKAWLLRVALNQCRKFHRSAWNRRRDGGEWDSAREPDRTNRPGRMEKSAEDGGTLTPEEQTIRSEEAGEVLQAVLSLPVKYREVIHLFYYEELSVREIAELLERRESTVTAQLTRGRGMLRRILKEDYDFA